LCTQDIARKADGISPALISSPALDGPTLEDILAEVIAAIFSLIFLWVKEPTQIQIK
jgi:hypothetical protein